MSLWSRLANVLRSDRVNRDLDEELASHVAEALEHGRDPAEVRRAFGPMLRPREASRDIKLVPWLDSFRLDVVFGWRQLRKNRITSIVAILSLGLAIGAATSAFRLIDAVLLRPLPVAHPERLHLLARQGVTDEGLTATSDVWAYPSFRLMRAAVADRAELIAVSHAERADVAYAPDEQIEKACRQFVSGWMFPTFGARPALGRLFTDRDDVTPGGHPYAVLSYDYWTRRFGRDPHVIGRTFRMDTIVYEIVGVGPPAFTGTETGTVVDLFVPTMMYPAVVRDDSTWIRILASVAPGTAIEPLRLTLHATSRAFEVERAKGFTGMSQESIDKFLDLKTVLLPASAGASGLQTDYRPALVALGVLVALVLLIACANVANLLIAQAASRAREMALRVSIGAGRARLAQLVLVEGALLACGAAAIGALVSWWSAPFVVSQINPPDNPARLSLPLDWRVLGFGLALALAVTLLFGLAPAVSASAVTPVRALKGGDDPHARRRSMRALFAAQVAFCVLVLFVAGLFVATFVRLSHRDLGFSPDRLLVLDAAGERPQPPAVWADVLDQLRAMPGVEAAAYAGFPLLGGNAVNGFVSINGAPPGPVLTYFLPVSPGWTTAMRITLVAGRDLRQDDTSPGAAIVSEAFVKEYLAGQHPLGQFFMRGTIRYQIVGVARDAAYRTVREAMEPVAYISMRSMAATGSLQPIRRGTFVVRTTGAEPMAMASSLRQEVSRARPELRVSTIRTQQELDESFTVRERLLAMLAWFFAGVALLLTGIGLYGVLHYGVVQRRREIGIRRAIGAPARDIARRVAGEIVVTLAAGTVMGLGGGLLSVPYIGGLFYEVKATDASMLAGPALAILAVAVLAGLTPVLRALRVNPIVVLRPE